MLDEITYLSRVGFVEVIDGRVYTIYVRILVTVFDLPARASIWNVIQYNGKNALHYKDFKHFSNNTKKADKFPKLSFSNYALKKLELN